MQIEIKPDNITSLVEDAILKSCLSKQISSGIEAALKTDYYGNGIISAAVKSFVQSHIEKTLRDENSVEGIQCREMVEASLKEYIKSEAAKSLIGNIIGKIKTWN